MVKFDGICYTLSLESQVILAVYPLTGGAIPPVLRKEGDVMVTYSDLFLFCTLIISLISLLLQIHQRKK